MVPKNLNVNDKGRKREGSGMLIQWGSGAPTLGPRFSRHLRPWRQTI